MPSPVACPRRRRRRGDLTADVDLRGHQLAQEVGSLLQGAGNKIPAYLDRLSPQENGVRSQLRIYVT